MLGLKLIHVSERGHRSSNKLRCWTVHGFELRPYLHGNTYIREWLHSAWWLNVSNQKQPRALVSTFVKRVSSCCWNEHLFHVLFTHWPATRVFYYQTNSPVPYFFRLFGMTKSLVANWILRSYLTGVVELLWHLSNMNGIKQNTLAKSEISKNGEINESLVPGIIT